MNVLPRSLFGRLVVVQVTVALVLAALLPLLISYLLISTTNAFVGRELDRSAALLRERIAYGPQGWTLRSPAPHMFDPKTGIRNVRLINTNPYYAISISPDLAAEHPPLISR